MSSFRGDSLQSVANDELLERLHALVRKSHRTDAALLEHIGEVDARKLYLEEAFPSMFDYCMRELHMEEGVAYNRIHAARAARQHPALLEALRAGELHLTGIRLIAPLLTRENCSDWLRAARHRSVRAIRELIADRQPKPDVEASIRKQRVVPETTEPRLELQSPTVVRDGNSCRIRLAPEVEPRSRLEISASGGALATRESRARARFRHLPPSSRHGLPDDERIARAHRGPPFPSSKALRNSARSLQSVAVSRTNVAP